MRKLKYLTILFVILSFVFMPIVSANTNATTLKELRSELQGLKNKKADSDKKKNQTKSEINASKNNIYNAQQDIESGKQQIESAKNEINELNKEIAATEESVKDLMNSYQIANGENIYLEYVFDADSYADLVYRYAVVEQVIDYNKEQIDSWSSKISYNEQLQKDLAQKEEELNQKISSLEKNIDSLGDKLAEYTEITMDIQDEIDSTKELIDFYVDMGCGENEDLDACVSMKGDTNFRKPLSYGTITSYFGYRIHPITGAYKFHSGVDIGGNREGTSIYSTANGMVGKIIKRASCGGNQVYVYHTINGKQYTSAYLHLLSINVKVGDTVTSNTVIGTVGGGRGTSSYDGCSTGAHLHFTIASGWYGKSYSSYSTFLAKCLDPQDILGLPNKGKYWSKR